MNCNWRQNFYLLYLILCFTIDGLLKLQSAVVREGHPFTYIIVRKRALVTNRYSVCYSYMANRKVM